MKFVEIDRSGARSRGAPPRSRVFPRIIARGSSSGCSPRYHILAGLVRMPKICGFPQTTAPSHYLRRTLFTPLWRGKKKRLLLIVARPVKRPYTTKMMRGEDDRDSYLPTCSSKDAQVAEGSFDLSTACPAGYVPFLSRTFCLFSRRRNSSKTRRFKGGGVAPTPAPTPAIHFAAFWENERINKWHLMGKRFKRTPLRGNETEAREAEGGGKDPGEAGIRKRKRQGAKEGPRWLLNSPCLSLRLTRTSLLHRCCLLSARRENETPCLRSRGTQCHPTRHLLRRNLK